MTETQISLETLYSTYYSPVFQYVLCRIRDYHTAEDLTQETFLKAIQAWKRYRSGAKVITWLYKIALNVLRDHCRHWQRYTLLSLEALQERNVESANAVSRVEQQEALYDLQQAVMKLPQRYRSVLLLRYRGYCGKKIAAQLEIPLKDVYTRARYARSYLRRLYHARKAVQI